MSGADGGRMQLIEWRPLIKNSLRGFASVALPCGLKIRDIPVCRAQRTVGEPPEQTAARQQRAAKARRERPGRRPSRSSNGVIENCRIVSRPQSSELIRSTSIPTRSAKASDNDGLARRIPTPRLGAGSGADPGRGKRAARSWVANPRVQAE